MERITIKYWQELPLLLGSLKRASSQLVYEWQSLFNPSRSYMTSVNFVDVRISFEGDYWRVATRLFQSFCQELGLRLDINTYIWLAEHTTIIKDGLIGDEEFNHYLRDNGGYAEVYEFEEHNKLVNWHGEDLELYYNHRDMEMLQRLGMEIRPNQYQFRSKSGYYLPIDIHIRYNEVLTQWMRRGGKDLNKYQITHRPRLTILGTGKESVFDLARYLYQQEGLSELLIQWVDEPNKTEYKITISNTMVYVKDVWKEENEEYVRTAQELNSVSEYGLESFKTLDILKHSTYDEKYGIGLSRHFYSQLSIPQERILKGLTPIKDELYGDGEGALGSKRFLSVDAEDIRIKTPYEYIKSGEYREVLLPLTEHERYTKAILEPNNLDTDIRIVLRKSSIPEKEESIGLEDIMEYGLDDKVPLHRYPSIDLDMDNVPIDFTDNLEPIIKRLTNTDNDFKYVPYILETQDVGDSIRVIYEDGDEMVVAKNEVDKRAKVVFKDRVDLTIREDVNQLTELLLSLGTDELVNANRTFIDCQTEETQQLIEEWLHALVNRKSNTLYKLIQDYDIGETAEDGNDSDDEDDFDIFEDIGWL